MIPWLGFVSIYSKAAGSSLPEHTLPCLGLMASHKWPLLTSPDPFLSDSRGAFNNLATTSLKAPRGPPNLERTLSCREVSALERSWPSSLTWPVGSSFLGVQLGPQGSPWLQLGLGELGQVGHDRVFVNIGIHNLLWSDHLSQVENKSHLASTPQVPGI